MTPPPLKVLFALPGLHRVVRGAEVALENVARELALLPGCDVTLIGSGRERPGEPYRFIHAPCLPRERFEWVPSLPVMRDEYAWEELTFLPGLRRRVRPRDFDITVGCSFPFTHWAIRGKPDARPAHIYVTQNGDWPCRSDSREFKHFRCDGLVCTNPDYFDHNRERYLSALIPNGVDPHRFSPGGATSLSRQELGVSAEGPLAVMVSALIKSKRVEQGVEAAARVEGLNLIIAGDGPERDAVEAAGRRLMPGRFRRLTLPRGAMPDLYRLADLFLHMSMDEPSANAYIEALATGLPIVTHDRRVTRWTLEDTADLVDTQDLDAVAAAVTRSLDRRGEAEVTRRREVVDRRFAWSGIARDYRAFFDRVLQTQPWANAKKENVVPTSSLPS